MFKKAKQLKAKQRLAALAKSKRSNPVNKSSTSSRISSNKNLRSHIERENEPYG